MTEIPIFVPFEGEQLAAIVTVPDGRPRALVLLLQGLGSPRAHRYGVWTRTARALATRGTAVVRLDYPEVGDSTGIYPAKLEEPPAREAMAVAKTVMDALGLDTFGVIGNCLGARTGFEIAAEHESCVSAVCFGPGRALLKGEGRTAAHQAARRAGRKMRRTAKVVRRFVPTQNIRPRMRFEPVVPVVVGSTNVLFLLLERDAGPKMERSVTELAARSNRRPGLRTEVHTIDAEGSGIFQLSLHKHQEIIDALVQWMDETLPGGDEQEAPSVEEVAS